MDSLKFKPRGPVLSGRGDRLRGQGESSEEAENFTKGGQLGHCFWVSVYYFLNWELSGFQPSHTSTISAGQPPSTSPHSNSQRGWWSPMSKVSGQITDGWPLRSTPGPLRPQGLCMVGFPLRICGWVTALRYMVSSGYKRNELNLQKSCYPKCGPWTSSICTNWEIVRNANSQVPPLPPPTAPTPNWIRSSFSLSGWGPVICVLISPSGDTQWCLRTSGLE